VNFGRITPLKGAAAVIAVAALIQLVPVKRDNPPVKTEVAAPPGVKSILERSCYDCHSNRTVWPWYSYVAPVSWLVANDVRGGRREVNFTDWPFFDQGEQEHILSHIVKQVQRRSMPLPIYLVMHPKARLTEADRQTLIDWAKVD
jgi:hypothetical protein